MGRFGLRATRGTAGFPLLGAFAVVAGVCALSGVVNIAQTPPPVKLVRPTTASPHAYYDALVARPDKRSSYSLRSQAQLDALVNSGPSTFFQYVWPNDDYPRPQDAAKLFKPPRSQFSTVFPGNPYGNIGDENIPGQKTLRFPIGITSGTALMTWDVYWGEEFQTNAGWASTNPVDAWKTFIMDSRGSGSEKLAWVAHDHTLRARSTPGLVSKHHEGLGNSQVTRAAGMITRDPLLPTGEGAHKGQTFGTYYNRWTRYWLEYRMSVPGSEFTEWSQSALGGVPLTGTWDMVSLWIADEQRNATRVFYRVPAARRPEDTMIGPLRFAWDTSTNNSVGGGLTGPVIAYVRNFVVLQNAVVDDTGSAVTTGVKPSPPKNVRIVP